ncbi:MAG: MoxR family ATPase [Bdellovibrionota bacterium]
MSDLNQLAELIKHEGGFIKQLESEMGRVIIGQKKMVERILMGLLSGGHILLEGLPGLAKTLAVKTLADLIDLNFRRLQFTPDLLPSDLTGTMIYNPKSGEFFPKKGPIFANIVLADEINRAPAKVQSALLECMAEKQVTIGEQTYKLEEPFVVLATQNPIEQEGTYRLPEAQMDRFMFKVLIPYPSKTEEMKILETQSGLKDAPLKPVATSNQILKARGLCQEIYLDAKVKDYIIEIVFATRDPKGRKELREIEEFIQIGASPRATLALARASRAKAFIEGRAFVTPDDVKAIAPDILRHRIILSFEAEAQEVNSQQVINKILSALPTP